MVERPKTSVNRPKGDAGEHDQPRMVADRTEREVVLLNSAPTPGAERRAALNTHGDLEDVAGIGREKRDGAARRTAKRSSEIAPATIFSRQT